VKAKIAFLVAVVVLLLTVVDDTSAVFVVDETEQAIVTQFGEYRREVVQPGLYFKTPFIQTIHRMDRRILAHDTPVNDYLTLDKKKLVADPVVRWKVANPKQFYISVATESRARRAIDDIVKGELRDVISRQNFGTIIGNAREPLMAEVADRVRTKAADYGVHIVDVRIKRADLPVQVQESVFARMRAERDRESKRYRSEGEEEAAQVRAETDKTVTIKLAAAYEKAQRLRGEGEAESSAVYAEAYGSDTEFYEFTKSLLLYEQSIGPGTELVLSSDGELFKYLSNAGRATAPGGR